MRLNGEKWVGAFVNRAGNAQGRELFDLLSDSDRFRLDYVEVKPDRRAISLGYDFYVFYYDGEGMAWLDTSRVFLLPGVKFVAVPRQATSNPPAVVPQLADTVVPIRVSTDHGRQAAFAELPGSGAANASSSLADTVDAFNFPRGGGGATSSPSADLPSTIPPNPRGLFARGAGRLVDRVSLASRSLAGAIAPRRKSLCKFLRSRTEVHACSLYLRRCGIPSHSVAEKDWDIASVIADLSDGNLLDMGSSDSYILNAARVRGTRGELHGIDLREPNVKVDGVKYSVGNLMQTGLPSGYFQNITCLSVIEHGVDAGALAAEASRLLGPGGKIYITFDFWTPKITTRVRLFGFEWNILDKEDVCQLSECFASRGLDLADEIDWSLGEPIISPRNHSPQLGVSYTFGMITFRKRL